MREYICDHCGHKEEHTEDEVGNKMYIDCPSCGVRVGMRFSNGAYENLNIRKFGSDSAPSKWEQVRNRPRGGF